MYLKTATGSIYYDYYTAAVKSNKTVIYLHGLGGDCKAWEFMRKPTLKAGYNFLSIDLPGHGLSYRLQNKFVFEEFTKSLQILINAEKIINPVLAGHCLGGIVALQFALKCPNSLKQLVLLNSSTHTSRLIRYLSFFKPIIDIIPDNHLESHINHQKYVGTGNYSVIRLASDISHVGLRSYLKLLTSLNMPRPHPDISNINIPTLVISGEKDTIFPPKHQQQIARGISGAVFATINSNHVSPLNAPLDLIKIFNNKVFNS